MFFITAKLPCCSNSCQKHKAKCISFVAERFNNNYQRRNTRVKMPHLLFEVKESMVSQKNAATFIEELLEAHRQMPIYSHSSHQQTIKSFS